MNDIYILMLVALGVLAILDLVVGVSNDAVNFLNSAIGSKALKYRNIMIIASIGIFLGAATSSGMMEVARKGIFVPGEFYFNELMYIFMAVMITDILLLDVFNTLGMPTSTTVSIVFELLGAAVIMAFIKVSVNDAETLSDLGKYINSGKALEIILGIFLSVVVAFTVGAIVMFFSRLVYSYGFQTRSKLLQAIFAGLAITAIVYFIIIKGIKGSSLYVSLKDVMDNYQFVILLGSFVFWTLLGYITLLLTKVNLLKIIIGLGTFSLALAFAGNDLVNFIGVPITALDSYFILEESGSLATELKMTALSGKVPTNTYLLLLAGGIMVVTLWLSKKAKKVTETEINLARQTEGAERFHPNDLSRVVVRAANAFNNTVEKIFPKSWIKYVDSRFQKPVIDLPLDKKHNMPAFDMVRASVNMVMAAILISIATSMKLPLSTTYVTFMVAMGTSLADRAWGLESAVYRVAGVFNVIGGWFLTAIIAFIVSGTFVYIIYLGKITAVALLLILVFGIIFKNFINFKNKEKEKREQKNYDYALNKSVKQVIDESSDKISEVVKRVRKLYANVYIDLSAHDLNKLKKNKKHVDKLETEVERLESELFYYIKSIDDDPSLRGSKFYILILRYIQDISQSINYISTASYNHVNNNHKKLKSSQLADLQKIQTELDDMLLAIEDIFQSQEFAKLDILLVEKTSLFTYIEDLINNQVKRIRVEETSPKNAKLYFSILLETKDLVDAFLKMIELFTNFKKVESERLR
ncbi:MAG: phosphate:sodium symporter [Flavobacteriia bacterium]|nr:MAG: phosphate:sodium symporter [Flavobacteriia bacterium]